MCHLPLTSCVEGTDLFSEGDLRFTFQIETFPGVSLLNREFWSPRFAMKKFQEKKMKLKTQVTQQKFGSFL